MRPSSVDWPVATATPCPVPAATSVPACTMLCRSAKGVEVATDLARLSAGSGFACERGLLSSQPLRFQQANVGADALALADRNHVARHDLLRRELHPLPVAPYMRRFGDQLRQPRDRSTGSKLLGKANQGVQDNHREHHRAVFDLPERERHGSGAQERVDQGAGYLPRDQCERGRPLSDRQPVRTKTSEPRASLVPAQSLRSRCEAAQYVGFRSRMPRRPCLGPRQTVASSASVKLVGHRGNPRLKAGCRRAPDARPSPGST